MEKVRRWLRGRRHRLVGLSIHEEEGVEELRKVIEVVQESFKKYFPDADIIRARAVRQLFGEQNCE